MLAAGDLGARQLDGDRQHRPGGGEHRRRRAAGGLRLDHRPGEHRHQRARSCQPTDTNCQVAPARVVRLQLRQRRSCAARPAPSDTVGVAAGARPAGAPTAARARRGCPATGSPVDRRDPAGPSAAFPPFGDVLEGEQHLEGLVEDRAALMSDGPARRRASSGRGLRHRRGGGGAVRRAGIRLAGRSRWLDGVLASAPARARRARTRPGRTRDALPAQRPRRSGRSSASSSGKVELMELSAARYADWEACIHGVPGERVRRPGPPVRLHLRRAQRHRPELHGRRSRSTARAAPRKEDYLFLELLAQGQLPQRRTAAGRNRRSGLRQDGRGQRPSAGATLRTHDRHLERRVRRMKRVRASPGRRVRALRRVGVVRVVGAGDRVRRPGRQVRLPLRRPGRHPSGYRPALAIDRSDWDDPDYMFLAFVGGDRPGRDVPGRAGRGDRLRCAAVAALGAACTPRSWSRAAALAGGGEATLRDRVEELQQELDSLTEEVEDLQEPVAEFDLFDECMYLIGVTEYGSADGPFGYFFGPRRRRRRPALALDIRGFGRPTLPVPGVPGRGAAEHRVQRGRRAGADRQLTTIRCSIVSVPWWPCGSRPGTSTR